MRPITESATVTGSDESRIVTQNITTTQDAQGAAEGPESPPQRGSSPSARLPESPPRTPKRSSLAPPQPLTERMPSTPLNLSKKSAFSVFMSPQRPSGVTTPPSSSPPNRLHYPCSLLDTECLLTFNAKFFTSPALVEKECFWYFGTCGTVKKGAMHLFHNHNRPVPKSNLQHYTGNSHTQGRKRVFLWI